VVFVSLDGDRYDGGNRCGAGHGVTNGEFAVLSQGMQFRRQWWRRRLQLFKLCSVSGNRFRTVRHLLEQSVLQQCRDTTANPGTVLATEILMRRLALIILAVGAISAIAPANAQTYDPSHPVCLQVFGPWGHFDCRFNSIPQCQMSASGRAAECVVNPYFDNGYDVPPQHRRHRHTR
jgi:hypothetical protein